MVPAGKGFSPLPPLTWKALASKVVVHASISDALFMNSVKVKTWLSPSTISWGPRKPSAPGVCVRLGLGLKLGVCVGLGLALRVWVGVAEALGLGVAVGESVALGLALGDVVAERVPVGVGLAEGEEVPVDDGVTVEDAEGLAVTEGV